MKPIYYYAPNTCALAPHIALLEAGIAFDAVCVDFKDEQQRSTDYLKLNPKGRVPTLVTEHGPLTETPAILAFIAQTMPKAQLAPLADPFAFAQMQSFNSYLCSTVHVAHAHHFRGRRWADDEAAVASMQRKVPQNMRDCFELMEGKMFHGPWVMGERFTVCDPYLFTVTRWLAYDDIHVALYPKISAHYHRMLERESVRSALLAQGVTL
jgi:glutathione S-transferase